MAKTHKSVIVRTLKNAQVINSVLNAPYLDRSSENLPCWHFAACKNYVQ